MENYIGTDLILIGKAKCELLKNVQDIVKATCISYHLITSDSKTFAALACKETSDPVGRAGMDRARQGQLVVNFQCSIER